MTKYVVGSGGFKFSKEKTTLYNEEIFRSFRDCKSIKVLFVFFAMPQAVWKDKFADYTKNRFLTDNIKDLNIRWILASLEDFEQQANESDIIFFSGGKNQMLIDALEPFDIVELFNDKTIATNSASSLMLSQSGWDCDDRCKVDGLGILPIRFIPHFRSVYGEDDPRGTIDWDAAYADLEEYGDTNLPILALEEGDFKVFKT